MITLYEVFPKALSGGGLFAALENLEVPWKGKGYADSLDLEYFGGLSGDKWISPLVTRILGLNESLSDDDITKLAGLLVTTYGINWTKLWATTQFEYEPIENYNMVEELTGTSSTTYGKTTTTTNNLTHSKSGTQKLDDSSTETTTPELTNKSTNTVNGFNSTDGVTSGSTTTAASGTNKVTRSGSDTTTFNTSDTDTGTQAHADGGSDTGTNSHTLTRHGNIGVTTSQQMIESERNMWIWNFFHDTVFPDIDKTLTLNIY